MTLKSLFDKAYQSARNRAYRYGTVGKHNPDTTISYAVPGRVDYLYITLSDRTVIIARNEAGVPQTADLQVKLRLEHGEYVIYGRSTGGALSVPGETPADGVPVHTLGSHSDVTVTAAATGDVLAHNGTAWVDEAPIVTSAGAGDAGKLIRTDAGGQVDATLINDADINLDNVTEGTTNKFFTSTEKTKLSDIEAAADVTDAANVGSAIDGATVSSSMSTTDKIAAVISGTLRYFTYQTIRDAIASYYNSVVATLTNKTFDASANTLTNVDTSALASNAVTTAKINNAAVTLAKMADLAQAMVIGRALAAGTGVPTALSVAQLNAIIDSASLWMHLTGTETVAGVKTFSSNLFASANVGLGTSSIETTSASYGSIQLGQASMIMYGKLTSGFFLTDNAYFDGAWKRRISGLATLFTSAIGNQVFRTAATGAAGSAITWIDILSIGADGNVGIGTTAPQGKLHVYGGSGGSLFVTKTGVNGTAQVVVANGTGDVTRAVTGFVVLSDGTSGTTDILSLVPSGTQDIALGGSTWRITCAANGELSVQRVAGSGTASINFMIAWI